MAKSRARKLADIIVGAGVDIDGNLTFDGGSTSEDLTFADGDKANFGDASDLQIYHDGSNSYITDSGTGNLRISGTLLQLNDASFNKYFLGSGSIVRLYYADSEKLQTTSSGISITGSMVATSAIVDNVTAKTSGGSITFKNNSGSDKMRLTDAGKLGIGTNSPDAPLTIHSSSDPELRVGYNSSQDHRLAWDSSKIYLDADPDNANNNSGVGFRVDGTERMFINNSGNIGGGGNAPQYPLDLRNPSDSNQIFRVLFPDSSTVQIGTSRMGSGNTQAVFLEGQAGVRLGVSGSEYARLHTNGFFGIGTTSPVSRLHVQDGDLTILTPSGTGGRYLSLDNRHTGGRDYRLISTNDSHGSLGGGDFAILDYDISGNDAAKTRLLINSSGNVGIGTTSPQVRFHVDSSDGSGIRVSRSGSSAYLQLFPAYSNVPTIMGLGAGGLHLGYNSSTAGIRIHTNNNIGIGVTSPTSILDIRGSGDADVMSKIINTGQTTNGRKTEFLFGKDNGANLSGVLKYVYNSTQASRRIDLVHYQTTNGISILDGGNVGIGTTSPSANLEVENSSGATIMVDDTNGRFIKIRSANSGSQNANISSYSGLYLGGSDNASHVLISNSGNVGINSTIPNQKLYVNGIIGSVNEAQGSGQLQLQGYGNAGFINMNGTGNLNFRMGSSYTTLMTLTAGGRLGIGTTAPSNQLVVKSGTNVDMEFGSEPSGGFIQTYNRSTPGYGYLRFITNGETMRLTNAGNVGIGTASPAYKFEIQEASYSRLSLRQSTTGKRWQLGNDGSNLYIFDESASKRVIDFKSNGHVGIGTTNPSSYYSKNLVVVADGDGTGGITIAAPATDDTTYLSFADGTSGVATYAGYLGYSHSNNSMFIGTSGGTKFTVLSDGKTAIGGNHTPNARLHIDTGTDFSKPSLIINSPSNYSEGDLYVLHGRNVNTGIGFSATGFGVNVQEEIPSNNIPKLRSNTGGLTSAGLMYVGADEVNQGVFGVMGVMGSPGDNLSHLFTVRSTGNVGIGTTNPGQKLTVIGGVESQAGQGSVSFYSTTAGSYTQQNGASGTAWAYGATAGNAAPNTAASTSFGFHHWNGSAWSNPVIFRNTGDVGIGSVPAFTNGGGLEIERSGAATLRIQRAGADAAEIFMDSTGFNIFDLSNGLMKFGTTNAERMRIDSSGNIRLGGSTTNSLTKLSSCTNTSTSGGTGSGNTLDLEFMEPSSPNFGAKILRLGVLGGGYVKMTFPGSAGLYAESPYFSNDRIHVGYAGVSLDMSGGGYGGNQDMLIRSKNAIDFRAGTSFVFNDPGNDVDFRVESNNDQNAIFLDAGNDIIYFGATAATNGTDFCRIDARPGATGHVIITGRDDATTKNHHVFTNPNGTVGSIQTAGSATAYNTSSDERLKKNIQDAADAGSKIDAIKVRQFDWKVDNSHQDYGMIAQELQPVAPEAVWEPESADEMKGVDYSKLVPMLVKEIQSLRARVAKLEGE